MVKWVDDGLNRITMYRLVLYGLIFLVAVAVGLGALGKIAYSPVAIIVSVIVAVGLGWATNAVFARVFEAPTNVESVYISALILVLIVPPIQSPSDLSFLGWAVVWTMASKFILARSKKHLFNPVAIAVVITSIFANQSANWWIGTKSMLPWVLIVGILIVRKIRRWDMVASFLLTTLMANSLMVLIRKGNLVANWQTALLGTPVVFLASIMLTEPLTTPPNRNLRIIYGGLVGLLLAPAVHVEKIYFTPELALVIGNIFSYLVSPKVRLVLRLKEKIQLSPDIFEFVFSPSQKINYLPGQYMEWTLPHRGTDSRGNRRYLSLASAPTESDLRIGVKFYQPGSSFKKTLLAMDNKTEIVASQLAGEFTLPENLKETVVFIAGGIGITPFRSMVKYMLDKNEKRKVVLFYAGKSTPDFVYRDIFEEAKQKLGIKVNYVLGRVNQEMIEKEVGNGRNSRFYLSGPRSMVDNFKAVLKTMGYNNARIMTDYFPGLV